MGAAPSSVVDTTRTIIDGIVYPVETKHPAHNYNLWCTDDAANWSLSNNNRTATVKDHNSLHTIRTWAGYRSGLHTIDFISLGGKFDLTFFGLLPGTSLKRFGNNTIHELGGLQLDCMTGQIKTAGHQPPRVKLLGSCADGAISRLRVLIDRRRIPLQSLQIWYDDVQKGSWTLEKLGLADAATLYPVMCSSATNVAIMIDAPLHGPNPSGVVTIPGGTPDPSIIYNTWSDDRLWLYHDNERVTYRTDLTGWRTIRTVHGYLSGCHIVDFVPLQGGRAFAQIGLVPSNFNNWNTKFSEYQRETTWSGFSLDSTDGDLFGARSFGALGTFQDTLTRIRFIIDCNTKTVAIWYNKFSDTNRMASDTSWKKGEWTFADLNLPSNLPLFPVYSTSGNTTMRLIAKLDHTCDAFACTHVIDGIAYPLTVGTRPFHNMNEWQALGAPEGDQDWKYLGKNKRTIARTGSDGWCTIRSLYGYASGKHTIDLFVGRGTKSHVHLGMITNGFGNWNSVHSPVGTLSIGTTPGLGFRLEEEKGSLLSGGVPIKELGGFVEQCVEYVRFIIDFTARTVQICYDQKDKGTFEMDKLGISVNKIVYPVYTSGASGVAVAIRALLSPPTLAPTREVRSVSQPVAHVAGGTSAAESAELKRGALSAPLTLEGIHARLIASDANRSKQRDLIKSYMAERDQHRLHAIQEQMIATINQSDRDNDALRADLEAMMLSSTSPRRVSLPTSSSSPSLAPSFPADFVPSASSPSLTEHKTDDITHGWSEHIGDYELVERLGTPDHCAFHFVLIMVDDLCIIERPSSPTGSRFYGASAPSYRARLKPAQVRDPTDARFKDFIIQVVVRASVTDATMKAADSEVKMFGRLPRHDNIVRIEHSFDDVIPTSPAPPDWDDHRGGAPHALFIVKEQFHLSLQDIIAHRKNATARGVSVTRPLFRSEEVLMVARDISSALILLGQHLVAHRDIKPDNILIRLPAGVSRQDALDNINQPGVTVALADFGEMFDFYAHDCKSMKIELKLGESRGGASSTIAPEIAEIAFPRLSGELNYEKADVWSLGLVLATMIATADTIVNSKKELILSALDQKSEPKNVIAASLQSTLVISLVHTTLAASPADRWSCRRVHDYASEALVPLATVTASVVHHHGVNDHPVTSRQINSSISLPPHHARHDLLPPIVVAWMDEKSGAGIDASSLPLIINNEGQPNESVQLIVIYHTPGDATKACQSSRISSQRPLGNTEADGTPFSTPYTIAEVTRIELKKLVMDDTVAEIAQPQRLQPFRSAAMNASRWSEADRKTAADMVMRLPPPNETDVTSGRVSVLPQLTGHGVKIGIIDQGCDTGHPEFLAADGKTKRIETTRNFIGGREYDDKNDIREDLNHHGTHVAGIAAGVNGVAPAASLFVARITYSDSTSGDIAAAIAWLVKSGVRVINISTGYDYHLSGFTHLETYCNDLAKSHHVIFVCAAGNRSADSDGLATGPTHRRIVPACAERVIAVGNCIPSTTGSGFTMCPWSVCGDISDDHPKPDLVAPGTEIKSAANTDGHNAPVNRYITMSGTSMSAPFVTGAIALMMEYYRRANSSAMDLKPAQIKAILRNTATKPLHLGPDRWLWYGAGCLNIISALSSIPLPAPAPVAPPPIAPPSS